MKTIILGVGNQILGDDGVGVHVSNELKKFVKDKDIVIDEAITGGMNLLELILDFDKAIIIDAVKTEKGKNGEVKKINLEDFSTIHSCNPHDISLFEAIEMAKKMGEKKIPKEIIIIGILMEKIACEYSEKLSPEIQDAIPEAVKLVLKEIKKNYKIKGLGVKK